MGVELVPERVNAGRPLELMLCPSGAKVMRVTSHRALCTWMEAPVISDSKSTAGRLVLFRVDEEGNVTRTTIAALALSVLICTLPASAKKPKATYDKNTDFSRYKTYAWASGTSAPDIVVDKIIIGTIETQLERAGLKKVDAASADLLVRYDAAGGVSAASTATDPTYASSGGVAPVAVFNPWTMGGAMDTQMHGSLLIRLADQQKKQIVWSCVAEEGLDDRRARRVEQVNEIVVKMFKDFPRK